MSLIVSELFVIPSYPVTLRTELFMDRKCDDPGEMSDSYSSPDNNLNGKIH